MIFKYSKIKDLKLKAQRGIGFEEIIRFINKGCVLDTLIHHNLKQYPAQELMIVDIEGYAWVIPYEKKEDELHLMTAYKSRKYTKIYLGEKSE